MSPSLLVGYFAFSFLFVIIPGVDWAYVISVSPRRSAIGPAIFGLLAGHFTAVGLVAAGVGAIVSRQPITMSILTLLGATYLLFLGVTLLRKPPLPIPSGSTSHGPAYLYALKGYGISALNPKVPLVYLAILPQFTDLSGSLPIAVQIVILGLITILSCSIVYMFVGNAANIVLKTDPSISKVIGRLSGVAMIVVAIILLAQRFVHLSA